MRKLFLLSFIIFCFAKAAYSGLSLFTIFNNQPKPIKLTNVVETSTGPVQGKLVNLKGQQIAQFLGIPFAQPPIKELRFMKPKAIKPWLEVKQVISKPSKCYQSQSWLTMSDSSHEISEDCLYLNIITTKQSLMKTKSGVHKPKPVLVFIHGGAFRMGSGSDEPILSNELVLMHDLILVSINHRLDVLGFLYHADILENGMIGNQGLWDQWLAMKWIKDNIKFFGGDDDNITVMGLSSGAKSISYHLVSPHARGLFKNAILQSGVGLQFNDQSNLRVKTAAESLLKLSNCHHELDKIKCLQKLTVKQLFTLKSTEEYAFSPIYGDDYLPFIPDLALQNKSLINDVNLLMGLMENDGSIFFIRLEPWLFIPPEPSISGAKKILAHYFKPEAIENVTQFYFVPKKLNDSPISTRKRLIDMYTDIAHACPIFEFANRYSQLTDHGKVYAYYDNYKPITRLGTVCPSFPDFGACHCDDVPMIFGVPFRDEDAGIKSDLVMSDKMMQMVAHFAKFGKPPNQGPIKWTDWKHENGPNAMIMNPHTIGLKEIDRINFCLNVYNYYEENLVPKSHVYRSY